MIDNIHEFELTGLGVTLAPDGLSVVLSGLASNGGPPVDDNGPRRLGPGLCSSNAPHDDRDRSALSLSHRRMINDRARPREAAGKPRCNFFIPLGYSAAPHANGRQSWPA